MFCSPVVKLKSDKITLKRLSVCVSHATKRKYTILYKRISAITIKTFRVHVSTTAGTDIIDITPEIERIAARAGDGAVLLFVPGSTAALTTIDTLVKSPDAALRFILSHCGVQHVRHHNTPAGMKKR